MHKTRFYAYTVSVPVWLSVAFSSATLAIESSPAKTVVSIQGDKFFINGSPTYKRRIWNASSIEGMLLNSRMVQGIFDDLNPATRKNFKYPDTAEWDPDRNTREFVSSMSQWRDCGLNSFTLNMQGGSPLGYGNKDWYNSAYTREGRLRSDYLVRLDKILSRADELEMVVILGLFYFGQDQNLDDEAAVFRSVDETLNWLASKDYKHVLIEVGNESDSSGYKHTVLQAPEVHRLIRYVQQFEPSFLVGTSFGGGVVPTANVIEVSDFLLIHGNGVDSHDDLLELIAKTKQARGSRNIPIVMNEDDHYKFDSEECNFQTCIKQGVSWGFFDYRRDGEPFAEGYQSVPVDWGINSDRKQSFFRLVSEVAGSDQ